jgi:uncharacterized protein YndB with AHSA1/START domain
MNWIERRQRARRRRRLLRGAALAAALLALLFLAGAALPAVRVRSGTVTLANSRESVWRILMDLDGMPRWRSDLARLERLPDLEGRPAWRESGGAGDRVIQLAVADPPARLVMRRADRPSGEERIIELADVPGRPGTLVRVTEREPVAPLGRVLGRLLPRREGTLRFLHDLTRFLTARRGQVASGF